MNTVYCRFIIAIGLLLYSNKLVAQLYDPCDKLATRETRELYYSMQRLAGAAVMFGHHDDTAYGIGWCFEPGMSDVKTITGDYPAVYGWDLAKIEHDSTRDINNIPFAYQRKMIGDAYNRGGVNTFCWHMDNPATGKSAWDSTGKILAGLLPGGRYHDNYLKYLDKAAAYMASLKGATGESVPLIFRPFHELTGNWFWWGAKYSTPGEFKAFWQFTVTYLRNNRKLHNLLMVYSVADFNSVEEFMLRYPGNEYVDFVGFDLYCDKSIEAYQVNLDKRLTLLDVVALKNHKLACLPETGYSQIPQADWWTSVLLPAIGNHKISYAMVWRNAHMDHYYTPYIGQVSEGDFRKFARDPKVIFQNRAARLGLYGKYVFQSNNKWDEF